METWNYELRSKEKGTQDDLPCLNEPADDSENWREEAASERVSREEVPTSGLVVAKEATDMDSATTVLLKLIQEMQDDRKKEERRRKKKKQRDNERKLEENARTALERLD